MDNWWCEGEHQGDETPEEGERSPAMPGSSRRVSDGTDNGVGHGRIPPTLGYKADDQSIVAITAASRAAVLNANLMAKAYEQLVNS